MKKRYLQAVKFVVSVCIIGMSCIPSRAQFAIVLSLAIPDNLTTLFSSQIISQFETLNPGIQIEIRPFSIKFADAVASPDHYMQNVRDLVGTADVVVVTSDHFTSQASRANAVIDLQPLVDQDTTLNPNDFYPALWHSFQWDSRLWALPISGQLGVLNYDPAAFDQAGLTYPTDNWTIDQLSNAVRKLSYKDANGQVQRV